MGLLAIFKSFVFTFLAVGVIVLLTPLRKKQWWKGVFLILALGLPLSFFQAHLTLSGYIADALKRLTKNPEDSTAFSYLVGDFIPAKKALFGPVPPLAVAYLEDVVVSGEPCESARALKALGEDVDLAAACGDGS